MWEQYARDPDKLELMRRMHRNVVEEWKILLRAIKPAGSAYPP
jgi:hypothetical protein